MLSQLMDERTSCTTRNSAAERAARLLEAAARHLSLDQGGSGTARDGGGAEPPDPRAGRAVSASSHSSGGVRVARADGGGQGSSTPACRRASSTSGTRWRGVSRRGRRARVLVVSTPPAASTSEVAGCRGSTASSSACPEIDAARVLVAQQRQFWRPTRRRQSADAQPTGSMPPHDAALVSREAARACPWCRSAALDLVETHGPFASPEALKGVPLIHDDTLAGQCRHARPGPTGSRRAGVDGVDAGAGRGLRSNSARPRARRDGRRRRCARSPHDVLAYDELRTGRLIMPFDLTLPSGRCYCFVCEKKWRESANVQVFRAWLKEGRPPSTGASARRTQLERGPRRDRPRCAECENGKSAAPVCGFDATGSASLTWIRGRHSSPPSTRPPVPRKRP